MKRNKNFDGKTLVYLISSPIGNLEDLSPRALKALEESDIIAAEDTRNTKRLLDKFNIKKQLFSLREHNESEASDYLISLAKQGQKVAYLSDAGYPTISDPGNILVKKLVENNINVSVIPGPSAFLSGLVCSGLSTEHFYFHGFLSPKENERIKELTNLKSRKETIIFYESPHRIHEMIKSLLDVLGNRKACLARELTKINEEYIYGSLSELADIDENTLIGEMVIVVEGLSEEIQISNEDLLNRLNTLVLRGISNKDACEIVSEEFHVKKNYVYNISLKK